MEFVDDQCIKGGQGEDWQEPDDDDDEPDEDDDDKTDDYDDDEPDHLGSEMIMYLILALTLAIFHW